jgi:hypothetical protein
LPTAFVGIVREIRGLVQLKFNELVDAEAAARRAAATRAGGLRTAGERRADGDYDEVVEFRDELCEIGLIAGDTRDVLRHASYLSGVCVKRWKRTQSVTIPGARRRWARLVG